MQLGGLFGRTLKTEIIGGKILLKNKVFKSKGFYKKKS